MFWCVFLAKEICLILMFRLQFVCVCQFVLFVLVARQEPNSVLICSTVSWLPGLMATIFASNFLIH